MSRIGDMSDLQAKKERRAQSGAGCLMQRENEGEREQTGDQKRRIKAQITLLVCLLTRDRKGSRVSERERERCGRRTASVSLPAAGYAMSHLPASATHSARHAKKGSQTERVSARVHADGV